MTPGLDWRKSYEKWPSAMAKLEYCDRVMNEIRDREPPVKAEDRDQDVAEIAYSVQDFYQQFHIGQDELPPGLEGALTAIFEDVGLPENSSPNTPRKPAAALIRRMERELVSNIYRWTGHFPERTRPLVRHLAERAEALKQVYPADREAEVAVAITTLVSALAMNHVHRGTYMP
jgi:hypothetical protein